MSRAVRNGVVLLDAIGLFGRLAEKAGRRLATRCTHDADTRTLIVEPLMCNGLSSLKVRV